MNELNSVATFTFTDFTSGGNKITGVHKITYNGLNPGNNWPRYAVFTEARIEIPDKKFITYRANYVSDLTNLLSHFFNYLRSPINRSSPTLREATLYT